MNCSAIDQSSLVRFGVHIERESGLDLVILPLEVTRGNAVEKGTVHELILEYERDPADTNQQ